MFHIFWIISVSLFLTETSSSMPTTESSLNRKFESINFVIVPELITWRIKFIKWNRNVAVIEYYNHLRHGGWSFCSLNRSGSSGNGFGSGWTDNSCGNPFENGYVARQFDAHHFERVETQRKQHDCRYKCSPLDGNTIYFQTISFRHQKCAVNRCTDGLKSSLVKTRDQDNGHGR